MPELPEVETIRRGLANVLPGRVFARVDVYYGGSVKQPAVAEFTQTIPGQRVSSVGRRGKYLQIFLENGLVLVVHLRMTGKLLFSPTPIELDKHTHLVFTFTDGACLTFNDVRKFGTVYLLPPHRMCEIKGLACLGPEPLSADFCLEYMKAKMTKRKTSIKALLLNQEFVAGLGNIYADEALHRAGIKPDRAVISLTSQEREILYHAVCEVLHEAINWRGTTMSDYRDASGSYGQFQNRLRVYQRHGKPCLYCGERIERIVVAGRGTHYCPACQT
ncbi:MAG: bifunctional DNA-formamidopyrimidine glycosylase/DNA-(apurinic or apyrimidinic site) lyase [Firmicutes bacterium]|nr:bifunctional DNA-formamidopyrimidine glycosylase/DNA-(apurinic or apyrimidinic site) lyase [Bacillota bacterium]